MKKLFIPVAAMVLAVAASAFTPAKTSHHKLVTLKWFSISGSISPTAAVPQANATYLGEGTTPPAEAGDCSGSTYQCVSGFMENQVNSSNQLINNSQHAADADARKN